MRDGWRTVTLGELFAPSAVRLGQHENEPVVLSVSKYDGVLPAEEFFGKRIASAKLDDYKVLEVDQWVYSTIHIDEGSIARNSTGTDGVVSPMYTVMRWISADHLPAYFEALLRSPQMLARYADSAQGSINRRRSLPWSTFSTLEVAVPPYNEQQRIVDLIAAVDDGIEAAEAEAGTAQRMLAGIRSLRFGSTRAHRVLAAEKFDMVIGKQRSAEKVDGSNVIPYLRSANVLLGRIDTHDVLTMHFSEREEDRLALTEGDVLITEGSASETAVGVPAVWHAEIEGPVGIQNALIRVRARDGLSTPSFAEHWAFWAYESGTFRDVANGTNIKHVGIERAKAIGVPDMGLAEQQAATVPMDALRDSVQAASNTADDLRSLRSNLLTTLLTGEHEIPSSYDRFLEGAA